MKYSVFAVALLLAACATREPPAVRIPVPVRCQPADLPDPPPSIRDQLTGDAEQDVRIIAAALLRERAYSGTLRAVIEACAG